MIKKCQVFTPAQNVKVLLDSVGYIKNLYGKKVVENACGNGNILKEIVRRYIQDSIEQNRNVDEIKIGLENDIYGAEIDVFHYLNCLNNLNIIAESYGIVGVTWKILNDDFLKKDFKGKFDFVIGNPPYITYRDLDDETRLYLKDKYDSCKHGKFDYCYAFIEASILCLKDDGRMAYLIPSSIFKNVFAQELRNIILPYTSKIIDYTTQKVFEDALTSSAVLVCEKGMSSTKIEYQDIAKSFTYSIDKTKLTEKWIFVKNMEVKKNKKKFGDYFNAAISIATLLNEVYILKEFEIEKNYVKVGNYKIESDIIRKGVSPRSLKYKKEELILFPYSYDNNNLVRYEKEYFEEKFPEATKYLKSFEKKLCDRKSDDRIQWFEYGRSQALAHLNQPKLLLSTVITKEVNVYELSTECIPYSGIYIVPRRELSLETAKEILQSEMFYQYILGIGINANGTSLRITAVDINNYEF